MFAALKQYWSALTWPDDDLEASDDPAVMWSELMVDFCISQDVLMPQRQIAAGEELWRHCWEPGMAHSPKTLRGFDSRVRPVSKSWEVPSMARLQQTMPPRAML